eukprot:3578237-Prymnesium_polylepis.1
MTAQMLYFSESSPKKLFDYIWSSTGPLSTEHGGHVWCPLSGLWSVVSASTRALGDGVGHGWILDDVSPRIVSTFDCCDLSVAASRVTYADCRSSTRRHNNYKCYSVQSHVDRLLSQFLHGSATAHSWGVLLLASRSPSDPAYRAAREDLSHEVALDVQGETTAFILGVGEALLEVERQALPLTALRCRIGVPILVLALVLGRCGRLCSHA